MSARAERHAAREHAWRLLGHDNSRIGRAVSHAILDGLQALGLNPDEDRKIRRIIDELGGEQ